MDGVECNEDDLIISIQWMNMKLAGSLPQELENLVNLQRL
jgi:hypothetical protein